VRDLLAAGAVPRRLDREGVAALLWRGAAMGARLPVAGVTRVSSPVPACDETPSPPRTTTRDVLAALESAVASVPREARLVGGGPGARWLARLGSFAALDAGGSEPWGDPSAADLPSVGPSVASGLAQVRGGALVSSLGADALFGAGALFRDFAASADARARRSRPSGDPLDVAAQRTLEIEALGRVDAHRLHALAAVLPAATRAALSRAGPRPPDGIAPGTEGLALASDLVRRGPLVDRDATGLEEAGRAAGVAVHAPFLDPAVVAAARGLPAEERFGEPGSGGWLAAEAPAGGAATDGLAAGARRADAALLARLAPERLARQGLLVPEAVAAAVERHRRADAGWPWETLALLARLTDWAEREGLSLGETA
jgi:hypothetical protein